MSTSAPDQQHDGTTMLNYQQAGALMGVSARTVRRIPDDDLPRFRTGRTVRIHRDDLHDYIDAHTDKATT